MSKNLIEFNGKIASISEHCRDLGINNTTLYSRMKRTGESILECLEYYKENGVRKSKKLVEFNGKIACVKEHCADIGVNYSTVLNYYYTTGESIEDCLEFYSTFEIGYRRYRSNINDKRFHNIWCGMMDRCYNPKNSHYKWYGKKGIRVWERWHNYFNFEVDMYEEYFKHVEKYGEKDTSIDRYPNKLGNYEPNNVRWATKKEQANNTSSNHMVTDKLNVVQFAEKYNMSAHIVLQRLNAGWTIEKIINTPVRQHHKFKLPCGKKLSEHCKQNNYNYGQVVYFINKYNLEPHEALARYLARKENKEQ